MDKLTKYVESMCEDCMIGIYVENCRECLFNVLCRNGEKRGGQADKKTK